MSAKDAEGLSSVATIKTNWNPEDDMQLSHDEIGIPECTGKFFRYSENTFVSSHGSIEIRKSYRLLKRKSCPGCDRCQQFDEDLSCAGLGGLIEFPERPEHGKIYELEFVPGAPDWETGALEEWFWKLVESRDER